MCQGAQTCVNLSPFKYPEVVLWWNGPLLEQSCVGHQCLGRLLHAARCVDQRCVRKEQQQCGCYQQQLNDGIDGRLDPRFGTHDHHPPVELTHRGTGSEPALLCPRHDGRTRATEVVDHLDREHHALSLSVGVRVCHQLAAVVADQHQNVRTRHRGVHFPGQT